jgi:hypothetical protein
MTGSRFSPAVWTGGGRHSAEARNPRHRLRRTRLTGLAWIGIGGLCSPQIQAQDFFVNSNPLLGSDTNPGTAQAPWRSLTFATQTVQVPTGGSPARIFVAGSSVSYSPTTTAESFPLTLRAGVHLLYDPDNSETYPGLAVTRPALITTNSAASPQGTILRFESLQVMPYSRVSGRHVDQDSGQLRRGFIFEGAALAMELDGNFSKIPPVDVLLPSSPQIEWIEFRSNTRAIRADPQAGEHLALTIENCLFLQPLGAAAFDPQVHVYAEPGTFTPPLPVTAQCTVTDCLFEVLSTSSAAGSEGDAAVLFESKGYGGTGVEICNPPAGRQTLMTATVRRCEIRGGYRPPQQVPGTPRGMAMGIIGAAYEGRSNLNLTVEDTTIRRCSGPGIHLFRRANGTSTINLARNIVSLCGYQAPDAANPNEPLLNQGTQDHWAQQELGSGIVCNSLPQLDPCPIQGFVDLKIEDCTVTMNRDHGLLLSHRRTNTAHSSPPPLSETHRTKLVVLRNSFLDNGPWNVPPSGSTPGLGTTRVGDGILIWISQGRLDPATLIARNRIGVSAVVPSQMSSWPNLQRGRHGLEVFASTRIDRDNPQATHFTSELPVSIAGTVVNNYIYGASSKPFSPTVAPFNSGIWHEIDAGNAGASPTFVSTMAFVQNTIARHEQESANFLRLNGGDDSGIAILGNLAFDGAVDSIQMNGDTYWNRAFDLHGSAALHSSGLVDYNYGGFVSDFTLTRFEHRERCNSACRDGQAWNHSPDLNGSPGPDLRFLDIGVDDFRLTAYASSAVFPYISAPTIWAWQSPTDFVPLSGVQVPGQQGIDFGGGSRSLLSFTPARLCGGVSTTSDAGADEAGT